MASPSPPALLPPSLSPPRDRATALTRDVPWTAGAGPPDPNAQLAPAERDPLLQEWSGPPHDPELARDELLHEIFESQAAAHSHRVALCYEGRETTYAELETHANQLAQYLRRQGVRRGDLVALWLPRSGEVYQTLLAILKTGAAYVPLDPEYPADRVRYILADAQVRALVTTSELAARLNEATPQADGPPHQLILLDRDADAIAQEPDQRLGRIETKTRPDDLCYVIYTSGSTGRPKGVAIEHRAACNLVRAEGRLFGVQPQDRVYQGFSIAFDASVEEVWLAFAAGAALVVGTASMVRSGPALAGLLTEARVTVLSTVPTLLSMIEDDLPTVWLLILGGEACPADLVRRWARPGRRMVNTYGPTEATVIATWDDCDPQRPVTIGRPVPNYRTYILDANLDPVPVGVPGELCLTGIGLARGYVGRPDLTAQKFVDNPFADEPHTDRLYRTGDLVRHAPDGRIEFLGRIDDQVKIRGFRVELSEIDAVLLEHPDVRGAATAVRPDAVGNQQLIGYVIPRGDRPIDEDAVKAWLRTRLPAYMVPAWLETIAELPTLPSGKVDRHRLPAPRPRTRRPGSADSASLTPREAAIAAVWERLFAPASVASTDDFFLDLGGHSLLAATMVSQLRKTPEFHDLSVSDVYKFPTIRALATEFAARREADAGTAEATVANGRRPGTWAFVRCGLAQAIGLYAIVGFGSLQWLAPYVTYCGLTLDGYAITLAILTALGILLFLYPAMLATTIAIKWLVIGRYRVGSYPLWGVYYFRFWFVHQILSAVPVDYLSGTPLLSWYYRLLGARIGRDVHFASDTVGAFDLLTVGDDTSIGAEASLLGYTVTDGQLHVGAIDIGRRCYVGARSMVGLGTRMGDEARLADLSLLPEGAAVPAGQTWAGSPARPVPAGSDPQAVAANRVSHARARRWAYAGLHALGVFLLPAVYLAAIFPGLILMNWWARLYGSGWCLLASPLVAVLFVVLLCLEIVAVKWLLLGRVQPGIYPLASWFYLRRWFVDRLLDLSLDLLGPLYATLYLPPWYRLLGARLGKHAEVSTASSTSPDLLTLEDGSFIADDVSLGISHVEAGTITMAPTRIGRRAFVGNSALVPAGTVLGDETLLGVLSVPPWSSPGTAQPSTTWLGSPAIHLPQRQASTSFDEAATYQPPRKLILLRLFIEFFRVTLPATCFVALTSVLISVTFELDDALPLGWVLLLFPLVYLGFGILAALLAVATKWLLMGRYRPAEKPLWSGFVWRTELVNAMHEHLASPYLTDALAGTPFLAWFLRALGCRIGRRVFLDSSEITEFDLVTIGDDAALNLDCTIQTHLFEDRVMKMSTVTIGPRCTVGAGSVVLYDTQMEADAGLGDLSLLMKGESLPAATRWEGAPARRVSVRRSVGPTENAPSLQSVASQPIFLFDERAACDAGTCVWILDLDRRDFRRVLEAGGHDEADVRHSVGADASERRAIGQQLAREILARHLDVDPAEIVFLRDDLGRPRLSSETKALSARAAALDLNWAHSENVFVLGLAATGRIGVDVEVIRDAVDAATLLPEHCTAHEQAQIAAFPDSERLAGFFRCWTAKEAVAKLLGDGLAGGLARIETRFDTDGTLHIAGVADGGTVSDAWPLTQRTIQLRGERAIVAVVHRC